MIRSERRLCVKVAIDIDCYTPIKNPPHEPFTSCIVDPLFRVLRRLVHQSRRGRTNQHDLIHRR